MKISHLFFDMFLLFVRSMEENYNYYNINIIYTSVSVFFS